MTMRRKDKLLKAAEAALSFNCYATLNDSGLSSVSIELMRAMWTAKTLSQKHQREVRCLYLCFLATNKTGTDVRFAE